MTRGSVLGVLGGAILLGFAWFVWPTRYRDIVILPPQSAFQNVVAARQNRFTGDVEWLDVLSYHYIMGGITTTP